MTIWRQLTTILLSKSRPSDQQMCPPRDCEAMSPSAKASLLALVFLVLAFPVAAHAGWPERP